MIELHKAQPVSDRTSRRSTVANQVRLELRTGAYWLILAVRDPIPKTCDLAKAEFGTLRLRLIKIAARVMETTRTVRLAFAAGHPEAALIVSAIAPWAPMASMVTSAPASSSRSSSSGMAAISLDFLSTASWPRTSRWRVA